MFQQRRLQTPQKKKKLDRNYRSSYVTYVQKKCRMLNLTFLRDSYVTWERRRLQIIKFQAFGGLLGRFGDHFGSILGTFSAHFGGPERTWKHKAYKRGGGGLFRTRDFWTEKCRKMRIVGRQNIPKSRRK